MKRQKIEDIVKFLKDNVEPLEDSLSGNGYRAAAYLIDGTYLPCVIFRNPSSVVELAIKRFEEEKTGSGKTLGLGYSGIVKSFVTIGNCVNEYDIAQVELSKYAFPLQILKQIRGETKMSWTGFVANMSNGQKFAFGTNYSRLFFDMPASYHPNDIVEIINDSYLGKGNELKSYHEPGWQSALSDSSIFFAKPYFECYTDYI